jgi:hypothetical protein
VWLNGRLSVMAAFIALQIRERSFAGVARTAKKPSLARLAILASNSINAESTVPYIDYFAQVFRCVAQLAYCE